MKPSRGVVALSVLTAVYFTAGKLALHLASVHPSATPVWPCSGIALAALLILGNRSWPAIFIGAFLVNVTTYGSLDTSLAIAVGNTSEAVLGTYLVARFANGRQAMAHTQDIFKFAILAGVCSTVVAATIGVTSLALGSFLRWQDYGSVLVTWWMGDAVGDVIVAPLILLWTARPLPRWTWMQTLEGAALLASLFLVGAIVFGGFLISGAQGYPLEYLCLPVLVWAASRFAQRKAATAVLVLSATAIWGTVHNLGPFARHDPNESLLLLGSFLGVASVMTLALGAEVAQRRRAEKEALSLATIDRLTGLGNYRKLLDVIDTEITRSERSTRRFTILLLDLDGLKAINDAHGHPAGNRALCHLGDVLRITSRTVDTAARYGGDEFALVLPETDMERAHSVAQRIETELSAVSESLRLSVSIGVAEWAPGVTTELLLRRADHALYEIKRDPARMTTTRLTSTPERQTATQARLHPGVES